MQPLSYDDLVEYEGTYEFDNGEFDNGLTVQIAASPADKILFALLGDAKYPLTPTPERDVFVNVSDERVIFVRDDARRVTGYRAGAASDRVFERLAEGGDFPTEMWYPRLAAQKPGYAYRYAVPEELADGLAVGSVRDTDLDTSRIDTMIQRLIAGAYPDVHRLLIVKNGRLVVEEYFYEYDRATPHPLRSATKSFISALVGIAIDRGLIDGVETKVLPFFEDEYDAIKHLTDAKRRIRVGDLLANQSGLACDDWDSDSPGNESTMVQSADWVAFVLDLPMVSEPGTKAAYCSGGPVVLGRLVEKVAGVPLEVFAERHLFGPLGITAYEWRFDPDASSSETFIQLSLRPRDMAKFGILFSHAGRWNNRQVVSKQWVEASTTRHATLGGTDYGYLWWRPYLNVTGGRHDAIAAQGNGGQEIYLWPDLDMVVVLTGGNYNRSSHTNRLLIEYILPPLR
ncbi:MAG: serine hydrolase [Acidobacteriota bacterium]